MCEREREEIKEYNLLLIAFFPYVNYLDIVSAIFRFSANIFLRRKPDDHGSLSTHCRIANRPDL